MFLSNIKRLALPLQILVVSSIFAAVTFPLTSYSSITQPQNQGSQSTEETSQEVKETRTGTAAFISKDLQGQKTASGEVYDQNQLVAAHPSYPPGTMVQVTNLENQRFAEVRVIDRGAATGPDAPIIDVSRAAAEQLGFIKDGKVAVKTEVIQWGDQPPANQ